MLEFDFYVSGSNKDLDRRNLKFTYLACLTFFQWVGVTSMLGWHTGRPLHSRRLPPPANSFR